jgi:hypothetical protein
MTIFRRPPAAALLLVIAASTFVGAQSSAQAGNTESLLYERALMDRAGSRCHLFTPQIASALAAASAQARGAALRSGLDDAAVRAVVQRAELRAYATPCNAPDLATAAGRVRKAFEGYADLRFLSFPGAFASWSAERHPWPLVVKGKVSPGPRWRLSEPAESDAGAVSVGLTSGPELVAVSTARDAAQAAGARLVIRDPQKAANPFLDPLRKDLQGRTPPRWLSRVFLASAVEPAPASLLPPGAPAGAMVVFPSAAADALAALDPREAATVELVFPTRTGERVETARFEVGDFAAGRAFLAAGR